MEVRIISSEVVLELRIVAVNDDEYICKIQHKNV